VPRSKRGTVAALAERHDRQDVARAVMRLAVTGRLVETKARFTLPAEDETPAAGLGFVRMSFAGCQRCHVYEVSIPNIGGSMTMTLYVGLDVHRASISVTLAEEGRDGAVRFLGAVPNTPTDVIKLARRLGRDGD
jgi:hypothetical protein